MPDSTDSTAPFGLPDSTALRCALSALLLESLTAIATECDLLRRAALRDSLSRHVNAIEASVADMMEEIAGPRCGRA